MDFFDTLTHRYSCRRFSARPVERELLIRCMDAGRLAPSGCNSQRWMFIAVDEPDRLSALRPALHDGKLNVNAFVYQVPAFIAVVAHPPRRLSERESTLLSRTDLSLVDIGIAAEHICLAATALGLGSVIMGWLDKAGVRRALDIPSALDVPLVIALGYPGDGFARKKIRHTIDEVARFNSFVGK